LKTLILQPVTSISGEVTLPGSKSLSNRALLLSSLASGKTQITNLLRSDDIERMVVALQQLGIKIDQSDSWQQCTVTGSGSPFSAGLNDISFNLGNAGTAIRPLTAALCLSQGTFTVDGDAQMRERPIDHLVKALNNLGAQITYLGEPGYPPLKVTGGGLRGGHTTIEGNISSQYLTSLLLTLPLCREDSVIDVIGEQVSKPYLDITLDIMSRYGVQASHEEYQRFKIPGRQQYQSPTTYLVEGDASSASYFFAAAAIRGGTIRVNGIGKDSVQGDIQFLDVLEAMGAEVRREETWIEVTKGDLIGIDMDLNHIPDAAMTIATTALFATGPTRIRNIYNWRVKETDRMFAMSTELRKLGAEVETGDDYIVIHPPETLTSTSIDTYNDHRVAMAFSLAALGDVPIVINDPDCTAKTFPGYFDVFGEICD